MKIQIAIIFAIIVIASSSVINDHLRTFLEQERQNFPCGWPDFPPNGLPILEPFTPSRVWNVAIPDAGLVTNLVSEIENVQIQGLQQFIIQDVRMEIIGLWIRLDFEVANLQVTGNHNTQLNYRGVPTTGSGSFFSTVRSFRLLINVAMNTIQPGNFLNVRAVQTQLTMGAISVQLNGLSSDINAIINSQLPSIIGQPDFQNRLNDVISETMVPVLNGAFNTMTMPDLVLFMSNRASNPPPRRCFV